MPLSKCALCVSKKPRFIKEQEASRFLSGLGTKTPVSKIHLVGPLLFQINQVNTTYKMDEIVNKFLLAGDKFMPEIHLRQPIFTYVHHLQKTKKEYKNLRNRRFTIYLVKWTR